MSEEPREPGPRRKRPTPKVEFLGGGMPPELAEIIRRALEPQSLTDGAPTKNLPQTLRSLSAYMAKKRDYKPGDIIRFKPGLNNTRVTDLVICQRFLRKPIQVVEDAVGTGQAGEIYDTVIGAIMAEKGHFVEFVVDGRRLEKVPDHELPVA